MNVSPAFQAFAQEAPQHQQAWSEAVQALGAASALDDKTAALAYLAVMAAARLDSGLPFHVKMAKMHGPTRDEVISAVLIGLPAVGNVVTASLPAVLEAYEDRMRRRALPTGRPCPAWRGAWGCREPRSTKSPRRAKARRGFADSGPDRSSR